MDFEKQKLNAKDAAILISSAAEDYRTKQEWEEAPRKIRNLELSSYLPSVISLTTASFAVIYLAQPYTLVTKIALLILFSLLLITNEIIKRRTCKSTIVRHYQKKRHSPIILASLLFTLVISMGISFFGGNNGVQENVPRPTLAANPQIDSLKKVVAGLNEEISGYQATTWAGKIVNDVRPMLKVATNRRELTQAKIDKLESKDQDAFDATIMKFEQQLISFGLVFGLIAAFADFFLIGIFSEKEKIKRNLYTLYGNDADFLNIIPPSGPRGPSLQKTPNTRSTNVKSTRSSNSAPGESIPPDVDTGSNSVATDENMQFELEMCEAAYKNAKSNWSAWDSKIRSGTGTLETNKSNRDKWQAKMDFYASKLTELEATA